MPLTDKPKVGMLIADDEDMDDFIELIKSEKEAGAFVPTEFEHSSYIEKGISNGCVKRFTLMGKTIGLAINDRIFICKEYHSYLSQVKELLRI